MIKRSFRRVGDSENRQQHCHNAKCDTIYAEAMQMTGQTTLPPWDIKPGERYTANGRTWELTDHNQWKEVQPTPPQDIGEPLRAALSDYMLSVSGRRPTRDEMWNIYWAAVDAIEDAARHRIHPAPARRCSPRN